MSDVILRILSVIGITLLILLATAFTLILLLLFWPITYRVTGEKGPEGMWVTARADWMFGIFRARFSYPEPGIFTAKLLWKNLIKEKKQGAEEDTEGPEDGNAGGTGDGAESREAATDRTDGSEDASGGGTAGEAPVDSAESREAAADRTDGSEDASGGGADGEDARDADGDGDTGEKGIFFEKFRKIKYTILKIYDKIKEVWANLTYYTDLLREEDTALLWGHVKLRLYRILKNIRPRHIRADVLFGTGAPDTTGMVFGAYCMLLPVLGKGICVSPDFERAVLEGNIDVRGHITLYTLTWNALRLLLDRRLHLFVKKMKNGRKTNGG